MSGYVKANVDGSGTRAFTEKSITSSNVNAPVISVSTVEELEAAVAAQIAGQTIEVIAGDYILTESLTILLAANGGGLKAVGAVNITGAAAADEAILIDPAVGTATFEYTLEGFSSIKGGSNKIGVNVANTNIAKKIILYLKGTSLNDNGTGKALTAINTDGSNAIRIYADAGSYGSEIDGIAFTPKDGGDRLIMTGYNIEENVVVAAVDCTATFMWKQCKLPHEGITGGHANNICSVASCWTEATAFVPVIPDTSDFPDAFSATIYPAS